MLASIARSSVWPFWAKARAVCRQGRPAPPRIPRASRSPRCCANRCKPLACPREIRCRLNAPDAARVDRRLPQLGGWDWPRLDLRPAFDASIWRVDRCKRAVDRIPRPDRRSLSDRLSKAGQNAVDLTRPADQRRKTSPGPLGREILRLDQRAGTARAFRALTLRDPNSVPVRLAREDIEALLLGVECLIIGRGCRWMPRPAKLKSTRRARQYQAPKQGSTS